MIISHTQKDGYIERDGGERGKRNQDVSCTCTNFPQGMETRNVTHMCLIKHAQNKKKRNSVFKTVPFIKPLLY